MGYKKSRTNVISAIIVVMSIAAVTVWQFYTFVTFKNADGISAHNTSGGALVSAC